MQKIITLVFLTVFSNITSAQTRYEKFRTAFQKQDTTTVKTLLAEWEKANPNDPEFYTSAFNFYFSTSKQEIVSLQKGRPGKADYQLTDSTGNVVGYIGSNSNYNPDRIDKAMFYIDKGIEKFPDRLDMRFGKTYALGQIGDYKKFTETIIQTVERSHANKNNWLWTENKKQEDAENFMVGTIQAYLKQLFDTEDDNLLPNMIEIGETVLKYYPKSVEILSTTSIALLLTKQYDKAIGYLTQAAQTAPEDYIVLNNLAEAYKRKGDKANAIKYYELTAKYGDEAAKIQAKENIDQLRK